MSSPANDSLKDKVQSNKKGKSSPIFSLLVLAQVTVFTLYSINKVHQERTKRAIREAAESYMSKCIGTAEERIACMSDKLKEVRQVAEPVSFYYLDEKLVQHNVPAVVTGNVVKLTRVESKSMVSCTSNTYFSDWKVDSIYLSLDKEDAFFTCGDGLTYASSKMDQIRLLATLNYVIKKAGDR
jgi:hypothetical protein